MCGITGLFSLYQNPIDSLALLRMTRRLSHRGPDEGGLVLFPSGSAHLLMGDEAMAHAGEERGMHGGFGHRRLSIIDLADGHQPMSDSARGHWIVFNGEIYNFQKLRRQLESEGFHFQTRCDTEVLLASLIRWGTAALDHLVGMFAFAWWDAQARRLVLARDRMGIKPLYYHASSRTGLLAFGSEIKAILEVPGLDRELDREALRDFLAYRYIPGPRTIYREIKCLPPGHLLQIWPDEGWFAEPECWWRLSPKPRQGGSLKEAAEELDSLLGEVCRDHLASDVPLGVFLSGGVDSSAILHHAQAISGTPIHAISVGFAGQGSHKYDETGIARQIASHLGAELQILHLDADILGCLPRLLAALDQPLADPSLLPVMGMMKAARTQATVMLSGDGGDEVFAGYNRYRRNLTGAGRSWLQRLHDFLEGRRSTASKALMRRYLKHLWIIPFGELNGVIQPGFAATEDHIPLNRRFEIGQELDPLTQWQLLDLQTYLPDDNLRKVDALSMAFGVEVRVPLVDHRIVEFGLSLPQQWRATADQGKIVLRESLRPHLPPPILERGKFGFKVPLRAWIGRGVLADTVRDFMQEDQPIWCVVRREAVVPWLTPKSGGHTTHLKKIWSLVVLNAWLRQSGVLE